MMTSKTKNDFAFHIFFPPERVRSYLHINDERKSVTISYVECSQFCYFNINQSEEVSLPTNNCQLADKTSG